MTAITEISIDHNEHCKLGSELIYKYWNRVKTNCRPGHHFEKALHHLMGNKQGGHIFLILHSGKRINKFAKTKLPMPNEL